MIQMDKKEKRYLFKEISYMVPQLRDPGYERLGPIGYVVKAGRRETIRRIQNLKVNSSQYQQPCLWCNSGDREGHLDRDLSSLGHHMDPRDGEMAFSWTEPQASLHPDLADSQRVGL